MPRTGTNRWSLVAAAGLLALAGTMNGTVVVVALPAIEADLDLSAGSVQWILLAMVIPMIAMALSAGRWVDQIGVRPAVLGSGIVFVGAGVAAAMASTFGPIVASRGIQGAATAVLMAAAPKLAVSAVGPGARARSLGVVATLASVGAISGPAVGSIFSEWWGWSAVFLVAVPLMLLAGAAVVAGGTPKGAMSRPAHPWWTEVAVLGGATTVFLLALTPGLGAHVHVLAMLPLGALLVGGWWRSKKASDVRSLLAVPGSAMAHFTLVSSYVTVMAIQFLTPFLLTDTLEASPGAVGLVVAVYPLASAVVGPLAGWLGDRGSPLRLALTGASVMTVGAALLVAVRPNWTPIDLAWRLAILGVGFGLLVTPAQATVMALAGERRAGLAGATSSLARSIGLALGPAMAAAMWAASGRTLAGMQWALAAATGAMLATTVGLFAAWRRSPAHGMDDAPLPLDGTAALVA